MSSSPSLRPILAGLPAVLLATALLVSPAHAQIEAMGSGIGWLDCNNDGLLDLMYLTPQGDIKLLVFDEIQQNFVDETSTAIPGALIVQGDPKAGLGLACGDVNNDNWVDVVITRAGDNVLLLNNQDGTFSAASRKAGIRSVPGEGDVLTASAALFDYDQDGDLDLYLVNYGGPELTSPGNSNQLFRNDSIDVDGIPHFVDVGGILGVARSETGSNWGLGVAVADYDNDGDMDLYVANDYNGLNNEDPENLFLNPGTNNLYRNEGDGTFADVSDVSGAADPGWAMGVTFGDYNGDGHLDIFLANFWEDVLLENDGEGHFTNVAHEVGIVSPGVWDYNGWGTAFLDYDNDGDLDIHVANGYITNDQCNPAIPDECILQVPNEHNQLWENRGPDGDGVYQFVNVADKAGLDSQGDGRGAAHGDFDRDGLVDITLVNNAYLSGPGFVDAPVRMLYHNRGDGTFQDIGSSRNLRDDPGDGDTMTPRSNFRSNHWIEIQVLGSPTVPVVVGSRVTVKAGNNTWVKDYGASSYCSQDSPFLHFGLGGISMIDQITVRFPNGLREVMTNVPVDQILNISTDITPVRLLSFAIDAGAEGPLLRWSYDDDGDLGAFRVTRIRGEEADVLATYLQGRNGEASFLDADARAGEAVVYVLDAIFRDGHREELRRQSFRYQPPVSTVRLLQNYPNPFAAGTAIPVEGRGTVEVGVFDVTGRLLRTLQGTFPEGQGLLHWDGRDTNGRPVPSGTYFYRIGGSSGTTLKMIRQF